jgi:hypothetical protein
MDVESLASYLSKRSSIWLDANQSLGIVPWEVWAYRCGSVKLKVKIAHAMVRDLEGYSIEFLDSETFMFRQISF